MEQKSYVSLSQASTHLKLSENEIISILKKLGILIENGPRAEMTSDEFEKLANSLNYVGPVIMHSNRVWKDDEIWRDENSFQGTHSELIIVGDNASTKEPKHLQIDFEIPDHLSDEEVRSLIEQTLLSLDNMHRDLGGHGLKVRDLRIKLLEALQEVQQ